MPIYEYRCENGHQFEAFQSMSEAPLDSCEVCDAPAARILRAPAVHFKGSGFYTTDYAREGAKKGAEGGGEGAKSESKDSAASSKPESKSKPKSSDAGKKPAASKPD